MIKPTLRIGTWLAIGLISLIGALNGLGYLLTPLLAEHPDEVTAYLAEATGLDLEIGELQAHWSGRGPVLELKRVRTLTGSGKSLQLDAALVDLHLPALLGGDPIRITLSGLRLELERTTDGRVQLVGAGPASAAESGTPLTFNALPAHLRLRNAELHWRDLKTGAPPLRFAPVDLELHSDGQRTRLAARVDTAGGSIRAAAELRDLLTGAGANGRISVEADDLDLAQLSSGYMPPHYQLRSLRLSAKTRIRLRAGIATAAEGRVELRDLQLIGSALQAIELTQLSSDFQWQQHDRLRRLRLHDLRLTRNQRRWPSSELVLEWQGEHQALEQLHAAASFVRLEDVLAILQIRLPRSALGPELTEVLSTLAPRGDLEQLQLRLSRQDEGVDWRLATRFSALGIDPGSQSPGIDGLNGWLRAEPRHARIQVEAYETAWRDPNRFEADVPIQRLQGLLDWRVDEDGGWRLQSDELRLDLPDIQTHTRLRLDSDAAQALRIDLQTAFSAEDLSRARRYYPSKVMRPSLVRWLNRALVSGRVPAGTVLLHGPLADFPFERSHSGHFEVLFGAEDLILDYQLEWPRLEEITAELRFHNNRLDARIETGKIYNSTVEDTLVSLPSLNPALPVEVKGSLSGPLADDLRLLRESPLRRRFADIAGALSAKGPARLTLDTAIPIDIHGEYRLSGALELLDAALTVNSRRLQIDQLRGPLRFDLDSVTAQGVKGRTLGAPVVFDIRRDRPKQTDIVTRGRFAVSALRRQLPWLGAHLARGASDYEVRFTLPDDRGDAPTLDVRSDLLGTTIELPAPLGKPAEQRTALEVGLPISDDISVIRARLGDQVNAVLTSNLRRIDLHFGTDPASLPAADVLRVSGRLAELHSQPWVHWAQTLTSASAPESIQSPASAGGPLGLDLPLDLNLRIAHLDLDGFGLDEVDLRLQRTASAWSGRIVSPRLRGRFSAPIDADDAPLQLVLERLQLDYSPDDDPTAAGQVEHDRLDPSELPGFDLHCRQLIVNDQNLGSLRAAARRVPRGLRLSQIELSGGGLRLDAAGQWIQEPESPVTRFQGDVATDDLGTLLTALGFSKQLEKGAAKVQFVFQWPGDPAQFRLDSVVGNLELDMQQGKFVDIDPGVTRVIGLLNFNALQRRLRLDFSDLFGEGFSFDSITGGFELNYGNAVTDDLTLIGPAGLIEIRGYTGLKDRVFDQQVTVTPRFDATLPVASAIAGGPVAGAIVLLAQQVMRDKVDEINRFQYQVSGSWSEPKIEALDSGGTLSKLFGSVTGRGRGKSDPEHELKEGDESAEPPSTGFSDAPQ